MNKNAAANHHVSHAAQIAQAKNAPAATVGISRA